MVSLLNFHVALCLSSGAIEKSMFPPLLVDRNPVAFDSTGAQTPGLGSIY
jgi:hypothetical protein